MQDYNAILQARGLYSKPMPETDAAEAMSHDETSLEEVGIQIDDILRAVAVQAPALPPPLPSGVRLVLYSPKMPPIAIEQCAIVTNVDLFIRSTLADLKAKLNGATGASGGWTVPQLLDHLRQVGVVVEVEKP
ncbi:MAG: hypothetical protein A3F68_10660 [Acidobacteria bacterium RIFCSPLOWO2_12_FULL_54_10]|nr:MAG: hypothetical protein A3F68_10660 [Acidobacteria bacterium RIFCSPLOWO2_12_FULL_54_10]